MSKNVCYHDRQNNNNNDDDILMHASSFSELQADKQLQITWQDDHVSKFDWEWLCDRSFNADNRKKYIDGHYRPKPKLWSKTQFVIKEFQAESVFNTDAGMLLSA